MNTKTKYTGGVSRSENIFFFDAVPEFFINYGSIGIANKTNHFAFQEAVEKRLVL